MRCSLLALALLVVFTHLSPPLNAALKSYNTPDGDVSALMIFERSGFSRSYGLFTKGVGRIVFDDQKKILDNIKVAFLINGFTSPSQALTSDLFSNLIMRPSSENEMAFVQSEPVRFESDRVKIKGELVINGLRRAVIFEGTMNKFGRIDQSTDVEEDGPTAIGISLNTNIKRSDFRLNLSADGSPYADDVILMIDLLGINQ
jgi:polyisoprenoid-binding protein YceI